MVAICLSIFLAALDITIIATALPTIAEYFDSTSAYVWVGSAFQIAGSAVTATWGKLSDIWGRKGVLLAAVVVFFAGSVICATAVNVAMEIAGRAVQGIGAGGILALCSIVIADLFSQRDRGKYYALTGMTWATAAALGPVVGGAFTDYVSWRWCFYINLPISGAAFFIIFFTLKLQTPKTPILVGIKLIDWLGTTVLTGGIIMFLLGLQLGSSTHPWNSAIVIGLIVGGIMALILFVPLEWSVVRYPVIPMHLFTNVSNAATIIVNLFHGMAFTQVAYFVPLYFQAVLGASPLGSGVMLLPFVLSLSFTSAAVGLLMKATGNYVWCIRIGFAENGAATATFSLVRNLASAIGVVIGSVAFANAMDAQQDELVEKLGIALASNFSGNRAQASLLLVERLPESSRAIVRAAFLAAIRDVFLQMVCFVGAGLIACLFIRDVQLDDAHTEVKTGVEGEEERRQIALQVRGKDQ
ncbi:unnamed protein product [Parascedosporium putredinis]|uniref:Major facilitator superfamily (MFS) profile domain-containing protein n=1 Tax=Parascedosporium putredinis TaxID=1442378 RepID=A0A9P1H687_9PEZI|nr:unnamed protein product [Parascedosporium putredinis]CAI7997315.1 unnamed protein product [Parascedosporium putredinis]